MKCGGCKKKFTQNKIIVSASDKILREIVREILLEHSTDKILARTNISKYKLLRLLTILRKLMATDMPEAFKASGDKNGLCPAGENRKNKRGAGGRGNGLILGVIKSSDQIWLELIPEDEIMIAESPAKKKSSALPFDFSSSSKYTAIIANGRLIRPTQTNKSTPKDKPYRITGLEGFMGYLKRKMAFRGGIRAEKLPIYIGEYVWKFNNRGLSLKEQETRLFKLISAHLGHKTRL